METAEIAGEVLESREVSIDYALTDLNFGIWQGKAKTEIERLYPELYKKWHTDPENMAFPEGDSLKELQEKAINAFYHLAEKFAGQDIVIVSHRVVNKAILCRLLGAGLNSFWKIRQDTACINSIQWNGSFFIVCTVNDTCHLLSLDQSSSADF